MKSVTLVGHSRLREIGCCAFRFCSALISITFPRSVKVIRAEAFHFCESLLNVQFAPASKLELIERDAFEYCSSLGPVDVPSAAKIRGGFDLLGQVRDKNGYKWNRVRFPRPVMYL
jgi:hypothetical protein